MKIFSVILLICFVACTPMHTPLVSPGELAFLEELTRAVIDSSRILPGHDLPPAIRLFGPNRSGITLIKPGGRDCYPSFWVRDYAMSLESGFITSQEQSDILLYTAARQSDSTWTTKTGSLVPRGSIPDHIRINDGDPAVLDHSINNINLFNRLEMAFEAVPAHPDNEMAFISDSLPTCDFGFRDIIGMTGEVCFGSLLRYRAALEMSELCHQKGETQKSQKYRDIAKKIKDNLVPVFADSRGLLHASTGKSHQPDVWATAFAVYIGALEGSNRESACNALAKAYQAGTLAMEGQIRVDRMNASILQKGTNKIPFI